MQLNYALSDLFFNHEHPALNDFWKSHDDPSGIDFYSDEARAALAKDAEEFVECFADIIRCDMTAEDLVDDYMRRL